MHVIYLLRVAVATSNIAELTTLSTVINVSSYTVKCNSQFVIRGLFSTHTLAGNEQVWPKT